MKLHFCWEVAHAVLLLPECERRVNQDNTGATHESFVFKEGSISNS